MKTTKSLLRILLTALLLIEISLGQNIPIHHAHEVNPKPSWQVLSSSQNPNPAIIGQNVTVTWTINAQAGYHTDGYNNGDTVPSPEIISNWSISSYGSINGSTSFTRSEVFTAKVGVLIASSCRLGAPNYYDPCDNSYHDNGDVGYMTHSCVLGPADPNHKEDDEGGGDGTGGGGDDDDPPTNPDQGEIQLMNEIVDAESYTTDPDRGSVPTHSDAYVIVKKTNPDDAVMVGANDVSLDLTHSIVTIDSPAKRDLKGKLKLELETGTDAGVTSDYVIFRQNPDTGAQEQITLPYELDVSEPGHSGGGVHDWHTGSERFTFRRTGDGPLKIKCSVDPTQGSVFKTATLHLLPVEFERDEDVADGNWQVMTGQLAKALPGQKINLRINTKTLPASVAISDFDWVLPNKVFQEYAADQKTGKLTEIPDADRKTAEMHCYFADSGRKRFTVNCKINGAPAVFSTTINIEKPTTTFTANIGVTKINGSLLILTDPFGSSHGISFTGKVTVPAGWPKGKWRWVQLLTPMDTKVDTEGNTKTFSLNGTKCLDTTYPYKPTGGLIDWYETNIEKTDTDTPQQGLLGFKSVDIKESFQMFIMFLPDGKESRYVPTKSVIWSWGGLAKLSDGGEWSLTSPIQFLDKETDNANHPQWSDNIRQGTYKNAIP